MQKFLVIAGVIFLAAALLWPLLAKSGLGRLPGDISVQGEHVKFHFPIVTCLIVSAVASGLLWLINR
jgi:hypothetical protein